MEDVPAIRKCIRCRKEFKSKSAGHRVCGECKQDYNNISQRNIPIKPAPIEREDK